VNFAIIGCGLIGGKRSRSVRGKHRLIIAADAVPERAEGLAAEHAGAQATTDWRAAIEHPEVNAVMVATTNDALAPIATAAAEAGKHVLVEKPAARRVAELDRVIAAAKRTKVHVQPAFNHRFHPALQKARELVDADALGRLMFVRGRYGHGGRLGYDREWRANPNISGGGELLDQGVHLIDLARWFCGDFNRVEGFAHTFYWDMPVDDNGFLLLRTADDRTAFLHASCTEWKNMFSFEIYGRDGKLDISGLGGSYGVERIAFYKMLPAMGPPETTVWEYPQQDRSWEAEMDVFTRTAAGERCGAPTLDDARAALEVVESVYARSAQ
jgi:predicted dehydrogenase